MTGKLICCLPVFVVDDDAVNIPIVSDANC